MFVSRFETIRVPRVFPLLKCKVSLQLLCSSLKQVTEFSQFTVWENVPVWSLVSTSCNLEVNNLLKKSAQIWFYTPNDHVSPFSNLTNCAADIDK